MTRDRVSMTALALAASLAIGGTASAQLGSEGNPAPEHVYTFKDTPPRLDNGLGTMAERRAQLARLDRARRSVVPH